MDIFFKEERIRRLCETEKCAKRELGQAGARKLIKRLADLRAVRTVGELVAGRPHALERDREGQFALDLDGACRLAFEAADAPIPLNGAGRVDWARVTRVTVVFIGDYHD